MHASPANTIHVVEHGDAHIGFGLGFDVPVPSPCELAEPIATSNAGSYTIQDGSLDLNKVTARSCFLTHHVVAAQLLQFSNRYNA